MKRLLPLLIILVLLVSLFTIGAAAEDGYYDDTATEVVVYALSIAGVILLGIIAPLVPIIISIIRLFGKKAAHAIPYYVMFIAGAIWLVLGVVILILLLM